MKVRANISLKRDEIKDLHAYYLGFEIGTAVPIYYLCLFIYVGVFWASAAFKVVGIPVSFTKVFTPRRFFAERWAVLEKCE